MENDKLRVFNIQRFCLYDGPGIRTAVFLSGCSLSCAWCHNPESIPKVPTAQFYKEKCIGCDACRTVCPDIGGDNNLPLFKTYPFLNPSCAACGKCFAECAAEALMPTFKLFSVDELYETVLRDKNFYESSGGGVTFTGGEPLLQADNLALLMEKLHENGIHITVETAGNISIDNIKRVEKYCGLFLYDIKCIESKMHKFATGVGNEVIMKNFEYLYTNSAKIAVRIPLIENFNDTDEAISDFIRFFEKHRDLEYIEFMPFHNTARHKYEILGKKYVYAEYKNYDEKKLEKVKSIFINKNIKIR